MTPREILGRDADWTFDWAKLLAEGLPQPDDVVPGAYAVYADDALLYIGRSRDISRRLGQFVGALVGGWWLHSGGFRIFSERRAGRLKVDPEQLSFRIWTGSDAYEAEGRLIGACGPSINATEGEVPLSPLAYDDAKLAALFNLDTGHAERLDGLLALVDAVIRSVGRDPYPAEAASWQKDEWRGVGRRVGQRWRNTVYAGVVVRDGGVRVGLWAYEDDTPWFGGAGAENEAASAPELAALVERWRRSWYGA